MKAQSHSFSDSTELERGLSFTSHVFYRQKISREQPNVLRHLDPSGILGFKMLSTVPDTQKAFKTYLLNRENMRRKAEVGVFDPSGRGVTLTARVHSVPKSTGDGV